MTVGFKGLKSTDLIKMKRRFILFLLFDAVCVRNCLPIGIDCRRNG